MAKNINIFGVKFAYPRGLRKSPGANQHAICVGMAMAGKRFGSRSAVKAAFIRATKECAGR